MRIIAIVIIILVVLCMITIIVLGCLPSMNSRGEINECIGCPSNDESYCIHCSFNPIYWEYDETLKMDVRKSKKQIKEIMEELESQEGN